MNLLIENFAWSKMNGLIPAIVQHDITKKILMLGYMNKAALQQTLSTKKVTFFSRSNKALWVKGETSGNYLELCRIYPDCDNDSLLVIALPKGPTCHQGTVSCFNNSEAINTENAVKKDIVESTNVISRLEQTILQRQQQQPEGSYVSKLFKAGVARMAQKVGEEGVEVALAAMMSEKQNLKEEVADLVFHVLVLLQAKEISFDEVLAILQCRELLRKRV